MSDIPHTDSAFAVKLKAASETLETLANDRDLSPAAKRQVREIALFCLSRSIPVRRKA